MPILDIVCGGWRTISSGGTDLNNVSAYQVDFDTKRRMPKLSASFYRETIRAKRSGLIRNSSILAQAPTHRLVDHRFQVQLDPSTLCGRHHHEDSQHLVHGVDEIETAAGAV